jgi:hypothetical protein
MNSNWERVFNMSFASVYPHSVTKAEKKGRRMDDVDEVVRWRLRIKGLFAFVGRLSFFKQ